MILHLDFLYINATIGLSHLKNQVFRQSTTRPGRLYTFQNESQITLRKGTAATILRSRDLKEQEDFIMKDPKNSTNPIRPSYAKPELVRDVSTSEVYKRYVENRMNWDFEPRKFIVKTLSSGRISTLSALKCFNYLTNGYLDCVNVVEGTMNPKVSEEKLLYMEEHIADTFDFTNRLVEELSISRLARMHPIIILTINDIYGRYGEKDFDGGYAVELKERLGHFAEILKTHDWESEFPNASKEARGLFAYLTSET